MSRRSTHYTPHPPTALAPSPISAWPPMLQVNSGRHRCCMLLLCVLHVSRFFVCFPPFTHLAPGHYHPEQCKLDSSPAYSFGLKTVPTASLPGRWNPFPLFLVPDSADSVRIHTICFCFCAYLFFVPCLFAHTFFGILAMLSSVSNPPVNTHKSPEPRGAYIEDRIVQRRERRLASPGKNPQDHSIIKMMPFDI